MVLAAIIAWPAFCRADETKPTDSGVDINYDTIESLKGPAAKALDQYYKNHPLAAPSPPAPVKQTPAAQPMPPHISTVLSPPGLLTAPETPLIAPTIYRAPHARRANAEVEIYDLPPAAPVVKPSIKKIKQPASKIKTAADLSPRVDMPAVAVPGVSTEVLKYADVPEPNFKTPPLPPQRPKILNAPDSFIDQARRNYTQFAAQSPEPVTKSAPPPPSAISPSPLSPPKNYAVSDLGVLAQPSAEEILRSVEDTQNRIARSEVRGRKLSLVFGQGSASLDDDMKNRISKGILAQMAISPKSRLEIQAFATPSASNATRANTMSIVRAAQVQDFLIKQRVDPSKITVRALGSATSESDADRVDIYVLEAANR